MALTKPRFVQPDSSHPRADGETFKSIFDIETNIDPIELAINEKSPYELKTSSPIFHGKEKPHDFRNSIFDIEQYKKELEDPGIFTLSHFDEPVIDSIYRPASPTPSSLISVGKFALSPSSSRRSSLVPASVTPEFAQHYIPGLQTPSLDPDRKVDMTEVRKILRESFAFLESESYDVNRCRNLSKNLSEYILYQLKILDYERYKFACIVNIGQNLGQDVRVVSRSLWNNQIDTYISESFQNKELFAVAMVFAVYHE